MFEELLDSWLATRTDALRKVSECVMESVKEGGDGKNLR